MCQVANGCKIAMEALRILEQSRISPSPTSLPLCFFDIIWYPAGPVHRLFFYQLSHPTSVMVHSVVPQLKSTLALALRQFYLLAGNLRSTSLGHSEIASTDADSVSFVVAECEDNFRELCSGKARSLASLRRLVPRLNWSGEAQTLMAVQVTAFPDQGFVVCTTVHHVACDGANSTHFMKSWAAVSQTGRLAEPSPVFDQSTIANPLGLTSPNIYPGFDSASPDELPSDSPPADFCCTTFSLLGGQVQRLKSSVMANSTHHCSTVVVASAYVWVCLAKTLGYAGDDLLHLALTADYRAQLEASTAYFGNYIVPCIVEVKAGDLVGKEGVIAASVAIGKAIEEMRDRDYLAGMQEWAQRWQAAAASTHPMLVGGSPKFKVYDMDFGWGRPVNVEMLIQRCGAMSLSDSRDGNGVEIAIGFRKAEMELFEQYFSDGLKLLDVI